MVRPRRVGIFLTSRLLHVVHRLGAVARRSRTSSRVRSATGQQVAVHRRPLLRCARRPRRRRGRSGAPGPSRSGDVGRFFPTWSARIGSSRWPRSTRTASRTARGRPRSDERVQGGADGAAVRRGRRRRARRPCRRSRRAGCRCASAARTGWWRRSSRCIVTSRLPTGTWAPSTSRPWRRRAAGRAATPRRRDAEQDEVVGTLVALEDLVRDPAQGPGDVAGGEHLTRGRAAGVEGRVSSVRAGWAAATT